MYDLVCLSVKRCSNEGNGDQASANQLVDVDGVKTYQEILMGAAAQATVQGYKYWTTNVSDDFMQNFCNLLCKTDKKSR